MKTTKPICPAVLFLGLFFASLSGSLACTVFCDSQNGVALAGRNWDMIEENNPPVMWIVPASNTAHGRVCFGRHDDCEDGMNDQGLFVAVAAAPPSGRFMSRQPPVLSAAALDGMLADCASVEEAIGWLKKRPNILINGSWGTYRFLGLFGKSYSNSGVGGHFLIADKSGDSVVCEWVKGKLKVVRKTGRYQLTTNFLLSNPKGGNHPCPRFATLTEFFNHSEKPTMETSTRALKLTSRILTRYSLVYDLANGEVHAYFSRDFARPVKINLAEELRKGPRELALNELFGVQPERLAMPKVARTNAISADEVLRKALDARGGSAAALNIRSIHARGTFVADPGWIAASPVEMFATRSNQWRLIIEEKSAVGLKPGRQDWGFDGQIGWEAGSGEPPETLKGKRLAQHRDVAEFFAWCDDPKNHQSAECLGEALFEGKTCHALKLVTKSGREETHYYDTTNFLLSGILAMVETDVGPTLHKTTFGDYREFGGFQFPTRQAWRTEWGVGEVQYASLEVNTVKESAFKPPTELQMQPRHSSKMPSANKR